MSHYNSYIHRPLVKSNGIYEVGQLIEVYDSIYKIWSVAQIIDIKNNKIKINWYGWDSQFDKWIKRNDTTELCPLQTHTFPMKSLSKPPQNMSFSAKKAIVHNSHIIFNTQIKYNFNTNEWFDDKSASLQSESILTRTIDAKNEIIYDIDEKAKVHEFNIKTKQWKISNEKQWGEPILYFSWYEQGCAFIENKLYVVDFFKGNYIYDINSKQWTISAKPTYSKQCVHGVCKIIYIKSQKIFIAFDRYCRNVYYCKYNSNHWIKKDELSAINKFVS
eukprot:101493_1